MPVAAGIVGDPGMPTLFTSFDMAAERRRTAGLDCRHHLELAEAHMTGVGPTPCIAVIAKDIRDLQ